MPPPWKTSTKAVDLTGHGLHSHLAAPIAGFTPSDLFASMSRVAAHRGASSAFLAALQSGAAAVTEALIDEVGSSFDESSELFLVADELSGGATNIEHCL